MDECRRHLSEQRQRHARRQGGGAETARNAGGMDPPRTNAANMSATGATESSHYAFIVDAGRVRTQASLGRKTKWRRKRKLTVEAVTVETALATLPTTHGERSVLAPSAWAASHSKALPTATFRSEVGRDNGSGDYEPVRGYKDALGHLFGIEVFSAVRPNRVWRWSSRPCPSRGRTA